MIELISNGKNLIAMRQLSNVIAFIFHVIAKKGYALLINSNLYFIDISSKVGLFFSTQEKVYNSQLELNFYGSSIGIKRLLVLLFYTHAHKQQTFSKRA